MIKYGGVIVDAGTASEGGVIKGDLEDAARERDDLTLTPKIGGVGPLTVAMLFENVIRAANK
jgi:methylenetetrahydrofolate dehydrogenase (NADP+)/methenyltetrahydrofolate cyclohydrolase